MEGRTRQEETVLAAGAATAAAATSLVLLSAIDALLPRALANGIWNLAMVLLVAAVAGSTFVLARLWMRHAGEAT
jgi:hypothetical protein